MSTAAAPPQLSPSAGKPSPSVDGLIQQRITETQRALWWGELTRTALLLTIVTMAAVLTWVIVDQWLYSPGIPLRVLAFAALIGWCVWFFIRRGLPILTSQVTKEYAARCLERDLPDLKQQLTSYVTLHPDAPESELRGRVVKVLGARAASRLNSYDTLPTEATGTFRWWIAAAVAFACVVGYAVFSPKDSIASASRLFAPFASIQPSRRVSILDVQPGDTDAMAGRSVTISAHVDGLRETETVWCHVDSVSRPDPIVMSFDENTRRFVAEIELEHSASGVVPYRIVAGDDRAGPYQLRVENVPVVAVESIHYQPPDYTGQAAFSSSSAAISAIDGTLATITAKTNRPIVKAELEFNPKTVGETVRATAGTIPMMIGTDGKTLTTETTLRGTRGRFAAVPLESYRIRVWDENDRQNPDPIIYPIRVIADLAPEVAIVVPRATPIEMPINGQQIIEVHAMDADFALSHVTLEIQRGIDKIAVPTLWAAADEPAGPNVGKGNRVVEYRFRPSEHRLIFGDKVIITAIATDNRVIPGDKTVEPNVSRTDPIEIRIVAMDRNLTQDPSTNDGLSEVDDRPASDSPTENAESKDPQSSGSDSTDQSQSGKGDPSGTKSGDSKNPDKNPAGEKQPDKNQPNDKTEQDEPQDKSEDSQQSGGGSSSDGGDSSSQSGDQSQGGTSAGDSSSDSGQKSSENNQDNQGGKGGSSESSNSESSPENSNPENMSGKGDSSPANPSKNNPSQGDPSDGNPSDGNPADGDPSDGGRPGKQSPNESSPADADNNAPPQHDGEAMERMREFIEKQKQKQQSDSKTPSQSSDSQPQNDGGTSQEKTDAANQPQDSQDADSGSKGEQPSGGGDSSDNKMNDGADNKDPSQTGSDQTGSDQTGSDQTDSDQTDSKQGGGKDNESASEDGSSGKPSGTDPSNDSEQKNPTGNQPSNQDQSANKGQPAGKDPSSEDPSSEDPSSEDTSTKESDRGENSVGDQQSGDQQSGDSQKGEGQQGDNQKDSGQKGDEKPDGKDSDDGSPSHPNSNPSGEDTPSDPSGSKSDSGSKPGTDGKPDSGKPDSEKPDSEKPDSGKPDSGKDGEQNPTGEKGKPGEPKGESDSNSASGDPAQQGQPRSENASQPPSASDPSSFSGNGNGADSGGTGGDADNTPPPADLDYAKESTDMVLDYLEETRDQVDPELLKDLKWTEEDLERFRKRWEKVRELPNDQPADRLSPDVQDALRSLGLEKSSRQSKGAADAPDGLRDLRDSGNRRPAPAAFRDAFEQFRRRK
ncbi:hypothetical protein [Stieleria varia]|uniref:Uncharacterized protein n=1 Tax=Stieleria varia TaxID=2528005 RepID=A0A5C6B4V4_9BACT|nr:hypothetical protein [Stieleria varia]TWU06339.1 hypothetical protein Pla52n_20600 [Stieleria varia]